MFGADCRRWKTGLLCFGLFAGVLGLAAPASTQDDDSALQTFEEGLQLYREGNATEALAKFQEVLAADPSQEAAYRMWLKASYEVWASMLVREGDYALVAKQLIDLSALGRKERQSDPEAIQAAVEDIRTGDYAARNRAILKLSSDHGEYAVPLLYPALGDEDDLEFRVRAIDALQRLSGDAVLPLLATLGSDNALLRRNVAIVLGNIRDPRANAELKDLYENDADEMVRKAAGESLAKITGRSVDALPPARSLYLEKARGYYLGLRQYVHVFDLGSTLWQWSDGQLVQQEVPPSLRPLKLAEDAGFRALALDSQSIDGFATLASVFFSQALEVEAMSRAGSEEAAAWQEHVGKLRALARTTGKDALYAALDMAMRDREVPLAVEIIHSLGAIESADTYPTESVLGRALHDEDKRIRYSAATALASISPPHLPDATRVVETLNGALGEASVRQILVIASDEVARNLLTLGLQTQAYFVTTASSGALGLERAARFPHFDAIVLHTGISDVHFSALVRQLGQTERATSTPILLVAPAEEVDRQRELYGSKVAEVISDATLQDGSFVASIGSTLAEETNYERELAEKTAAAAAWALVHADETLFNLNLATEGLLGAIKRSNDEIRRPALMVLGRVKGPYTVKEIADVFADAANDAAVRVAAADALGSVLAAGGDADELAAIVDQLVASLSDPSAEVVTAASRALARISAIPPATRTDALMEQRVGVPSAR